MTTLQCDGCTACCRSGSIILHPSLGDDPTQYACEYIADVGYRLKRKPDGSCIYLSDDGDGCSIWGRHPGVCKAFDCRVYAISQWATFDPLADQAVIEAGLARRAK